MVCFFQKSNYPEYYTEVSALEGNKTEQQAALEKYAHGIMLAEGQGKIKIVTKNVTNVYSEAIRKYYHGVGNFSLVYF